MKTSSKPKRTGRTTKRRRAEASIPYEPLLHNDLKDPGYAAGYLTAALEEGDDAFLVALRDVAKAQGSMAALAQASRLNRESLYDMLSRKGNPRFASINAVLDALGFRVTVTTKPSRAKAA